MNAWLDYILHKERWFWEYGYKDLPAEVAVVEDNILLHWQGLGLGAVLAAQKLSVAEER